ncbi:ABC-three component system protein [Methylobacterium sp. Leaf100]|uniref:ABC-three component system protein n=1 Tax=Methylobacterium sp. Leaf100 TaxID=1736252 RepID=UPI0006FEE910|nr:ABC-three component system protein [Methylobacterium sp. Leaf100]KQP32867.1 hypothetical protein ASF25_17815 [Methylobacterium sp. Leaf100]
MILSIDSSLPTFKPVRFHAGINVLLSAKSAEGNDRKTRNSAGKSSLVDIVHFLLGGKADPGNLLRHPLLNDHVFRGTLWIAGREVTVERSGAKHGRVYVDPASSEHFGLQTKPDKETGALSISNEAWKDFLAHRWFDLPAVVRGSPFEESFTPSFRALFGYFARRHGSGAFGHVERQAEAQQRWDWQSNLSYLLGLDWRVPRDLHLVKQREGQLDELKKAAKGGAFGALIGTVAELRPAVVLAEAKATKLREEIGRFEVHDTYREMMGQATRAKVEMQAISRRAVPLRETVAHLRASIETERPPERDDLSRLYAAVGIELPDLAKRRFEDVERFHRTVVENRRLRLREEIETAERELAEGDIRFAGLDAERGDILRILEGRGALEDFVTLQKRLADAEAEAAALRERFRSAEVLENRTTELSMERIGIKRRLQEDHQRRRDRLDEAILLIGNAITALYEDRTGKFEVEATENGPEFRITIQGDRGGGISNMEIFCLDYALFSIWGRRRKGPGFLIHDSHLFDGVDPRQVANALALGADAARAYGGQYIVTMNSDIYDTLPLSADIDRQGVVMQPRLSDADETSGLFGFRFD